MTAAGAVARTWILLADSATGQPDISPLAYWGIAGVLLGFILWLYLDERKEHKALRAKVLSDVLPALIANNQQMRDTQDSQKSAGEAMERMMLMTHQLVGRPGLDPVQMAEWTRIMERVRRLLDRTES